MYVYAWTTSINRHNKMLEIEIRAAGNPMNRPLPLIEKALRQTLANLDIPASITVYERSGEQNQESEPQVPEGKEGSNTET